MQVSGCEPPAAAQRGRPRLRAGVLDQEVVTDGQFTSSRSPADLPPFRAAIIEQFAKA